MQKLGQSGPSLLAKVLMEDSGMEDRTSYHPANAVAVAREKGPTARRPAATYPLTCWKASEVPNTAANIPDNWKSIDSGRRSSGLSTTPAVQPLPSCIEYDGSWGAFLYPPDYKGGKILAK